MNKPTVKIDMKWTDGSNRELKVELNDEEDINLIVDRLAAAIVAPLKLPQIKTLPGGPPYARISTEKELEL